VLLACWPFAGQLASKLEGLVVLLHKSLALQGAWDHSAQKPRFLKLLQKSVRGVEAEHTHLEIVGPSAASVLRKVEAT
jgi:hypothetical protein